MRKKINVQVLMAGQYQIPKGKRVDFQFQESWGVYSAACDGKVFGLVQFLKNGKAEQLKQLGEKFCGCIVKVSPEKRHAIVKVF